MKKLMLLSFLVLVCSSLRSQNGEITGKIILADSSISVTFANVYLENTQYGVIAKGNGTYRILDAPPGNYTLVASNIGYLSDRREITVKSNEVLLIDLILVETIATLDEVVVMTSGVTGIRDIPGSVQYIQPKEMQRFSFTDVNQVLKSVPGVNIQEEDGFGLRPNIGLRGTGVERSSKITIMEDGVLIAPAPYTAPAAYYFPTIGRMQAIEIMKGSSQIKYGPYTTGGAINLISTQIPGGLSAKFNLMAGSFGSKSVHANVGNAHDNVAYLVETFQYNSDGFKQLDGGGNTGFDKQDYLAKVRINTSPGTKTHQSLTFKIGQSSEDGNETYLGLTRDDFKGNPFRRYAASQKDEIKTLHNLMSLTHHVRLSSKIKVTTTAYRTNFKRNWYKLDKVKDSTGKVISISDLLDNPSLSNDAYGILKGATSLKSDALNVKANNRLYAVSGIQTAVDHRFRTNSIEHRIDVGLRFHKDEMDRFQWEDKYAMNSGVMQLTSIGTPGTESNRIESAQAIAAYIHYNIKFNKMSILPGLRYENILMNRKDFGKNDPERTGANLKEEGNREDVFIPGIGIDYQFGKKLSAYAGIHKGFSPPGAQEETLPEQSISYELGTRYLKNALSINAVLFFNDYSNLLGSDMAAAGGDGTGEMFNAGKVHAYGLEFQVAYDLLVNSDYSRFSMPVVFAYTHTDATFRNSFSSSFSDWGKVTAGDQFPYLANNQFSVLIGIEYPFFNINLSGRYMGEMRTTPGQGEIPQDEKTDSYFVIDGSTNVHVHRNISLFGSITNLTNKIYTAATRPAGFRPGMPRAFNIGLKANF